MKKSPASKQRLTITLSELDDIQWRLSASYKSNMGFQIWFLVCSLVTVASTCTDHSNNSKILIYSVIALIIDMFKRFKKINTQFDPLGIELRTWLLRFFDYLLDINQFYLLARLLYEVPAYQSVFVVVHFLYAFYNNLNERTKRKQQSVSWIAGMFRLQALLLFVFCKIISSEFTEHCLLFLLFSTGNLLLLTEVGHTLFFGEFLLAFWHQRYCGTQDIKSKRISMRSKRLILKNILLVLACVIVFQNLLMMIESVRFFTAISLLQSLLVGFYTCYEYKLISIRR